jgi:NAD(P)-dependent dehydrogenase (short-subunit alcohol dehydrogenase family)
VGNTGPGGNDGATPPTAASAAPAAHEPVDGRVALVSGGDRGRGLQVVRALAECGMRVVLGSRSVDRGRMALDALGDLSDRVAVRQLDVTSAASIEGLMSWLRRRLGQCDVLVNNATVLLDNDAGAADVDLAVVRRALETNLLGLWRLTQAVVPLMRAGRYGRIVNVAGDLRGGSAYRLSKDAVNALTRMLADELADDGILVNACGPDPAEVELRAGSGWLWRSPVADLPVWLATLPPDGPTGGFFFEPARRVVP